MANEKEMRSALRLSFRLCVMILIYEYENLNKLYWHEKSRNEFSKFVSKGKSWNRTVKERKKGRQRGVRSLFVVYFGA